MYIYNPGRSAMKQLQQYVPHFQTFRSKMKVRASKDAVYAKFETEITRMLDEMVKFVDFQCGDLLAEAEVATTDMCDDDLEELANRLRATFTNTEHHLAGAKIAKTRFGAMLS